ncbi:MAG TPA: hypothetical protein VF211_11310 [Burkholderiales bacterium]
MKRLVVLAALLAGCASGYDPHAPRTVVVGEAGGAVTVGHGQRLRIELPGVGEHAWRKEQPQTPVVIPQGPPQGDRWMFTPVRSGKETLRFAMAGRTVSYDVTVPEEGGSLAGWLESLFERN